MPSEYKNRINALTSVTLNSMAEVCHDLLPQDYKDTPWLLPYGDKNFSKIFTDEDQLNGYTASYTVWHKGKLERIFRNVPIDTFEGEIAVVDWGCGQGLATIALKEYIANQNKRCSIKEAILIEPSALALDRAKFNLEHVIAGINIRTINKFINDVEPGAYVFIDSSLINRKVERDDLKVFYIPATKLALENNLKGLANMIILGKIFSELKFCSHETLSAAIKKCIPPKKSHLFEFNNRAIDLGANLN